MKQNLDMIARNLVCLVAFLVLGVAGCSPEQNIATEYGKTSGLSTGKSINGLSVLKRMFQENGNTVKSSSRISPRINSYDTIIWAPNREGCPSPEAISAIQDWVDYGYRRRFVFIGRGFDAERLYWQAVIDQVEGEQHELTRRKLARTRADSDVQSHSRQVFYYQEETNDECDWFNVVEGPKGRAERLSGPWAGQIVDENAAVQMGTMFESNYQNYIGVDYEPLLTCDGKVFAFSHESYESKLIFVSNGSFLLNYGLVNRENRKIAQELVDECSSGSVLFLESGPEPITVTDSSAPPEHNQWAWLNTAPLKYIVPQFFLWGVIFCFVYFPIFGRPRLTPKRVPNFRRHIDAFGRLLIRSRKPSVAQEMIDQYNSQTDPSRKKRD